MTQHEAILALVSGKVQGVWFRASTQKVAQSLHLIGYAKNLPDGRVEVKACGDHDSIQQLIDYLHQGPELAEVSQVDLQHIDPFEASAFRTI
ncbi:acylphosphatase [Algicola sagamiensis]|uniref:acylphosphatase n=1 Tax=Algicola sagamiensis TaxID=163869 RepID=UPI00037B3D4A|nr:acylphosphatase [Algicola sagamiensis]